MKPADTWSLVFKRLSRVEDTVLVCFWMSNGAEFFMSAPKEYEIKSNGFADHLEFHFSFDEIEKIKVIKGIGARHIRLSHQVEQIFKVLSDIDGVNLKIEPDGLLIHLTMPTFNITL